MSRWGWPHTGFWTPHQRGTVDNDWWSGRYVQGSLRNRGRLSGWENPAASASLRVLAHFGRDRIGIHIEIGVVGLAAGVADLKHQISGKLAFHRKVPHLDRGREQVRIETGGLINRAW